MTSLLNPARALSLKVWCQSFAVRVMTLGLMMMMMALIMTVSRPLRLGAEPPMPNPPGDDGVSAPHEGLDPSQYPHLHNLLRLSGRIYSGGEPHGVEAFAELTRLGVRTVVSVDGAKPDLVAASRHGLRYVHIPIGYDGVHQSAGQSLTRLVRDAEGPFYIHCHHGKHRGPAAAAVACIAEGVVDGKQALSILERAGTSRDYAGLWRDVEAFQAPSADADLPQLVEVAEVSSLAAAMAQIDRAKDNLTLSQQQNWAVPVDHPDISPSQEAILLREGFHEAGRHLTDEDAQFRRWMAESEQSAVRLEAALEAHDSVQANEQFTQLLASCKKCHAQYRD